MYNIVKRASSGVWGGQTIATFPSLELASRHLNTLADEYEKENFDVDDKKDENGNVIWIEITAENMADAYFYSVVRENT